MTEVILAVCMCVQTICFAWLLHLQAKEVEKLRTNNRHLNEDMIDLREEVDALDPEAAENWRVGRRKFNSE